MSRVGKMPIAIPKGVDVAITTEHITVKSGTGSLTRALSPLVAVKSEGGRITVSLGERKYEVDVDWLTGQVRILD